MGQDAIEFVALSLGVPLYRRVISGAAVEQGLEYGDRNAKAGGVLGDETEDLYSLLLNVKVRFFEHRYLYTHTQRIQLPLNNQLQHPDVQGVSIGAILSNYQRVRVEHV